MIKDITGERFERLLVISYHDSYKNRSRWLCLCDCGKETIVFAKNLRNEDTKSCGCYRQDHLRKNKKYGLLPEGEAAKRAVLNSYKQHAKKRELDFALSEAMFYKLCSQNCYYCGIIPSNEMKIPHCKGSFVYAGIDRKDNKIGYTVDNCVSCCAFCNKIKQTLTYDEFINHIKTILRFRNEQL